MAKYVKPTLETKFHIDFSWWDKRGQNLRAYLQSHICPECQALAEDSEGRTFDWFDPETGEVFQLDLLWHIIQTHCGDEPSFIDNRIPLTNAIFRAFIINNNVPMTPNEIYEKIYKKSPTLILKTIGARQVYKGIKPINR